MDNLDSPLVDYGTDKDLKSYFLSPVCYLTLNATAKTVTGTSYSSVHADNGTSAVAPVDDTVIATSPGVCTMTSGNTPMDKTSVVAVDTDDGAAPVAKNVDKNRNDWSSPSSLMRGSPLKHSV